MHYAIEYNGRDESSRLKTVKYLVEMGVDINAKDIYGGNALHKAIWRQDHEVADWLLEHGAKR